MATLEKVAFSGRGGGVQVFYRRYAPGTSLTEFRVAEAWHRTSVRFRGVILGKAGRGGFRTLVVNGTEWSCREDSLFPFIPAPEPCPGMKD